MNKKQEHRLTIRIPIEMFEEIKKRSEQSIGNMSLNQWIIISLQKVIQGHHE